MDPRSLAQMNIKFAVREIKAFVGHSFAKEDTYVVSTFIELLNKLGFNCITGQKAAPKEIREKIKERIEGCEVFVGIFTRREPKADGNFTAPPWVIEEKTWAIAAGKKLLLFVETGVENDIGGLQGNYEYVPFERD